MSKLFAVLMDKQSLTLPADPVKSQPKLVIPPVVPVETVEPIQTQENKPMKSVETKTPRNHDTVIPQHQEAMIETIRKAVKQLGKEAATYRFTQEEKRALADIVYTYKSRGTRTSENEITRIAFHSLMEDYHANGESSILARVLERLNE
jgi:hypothetical protein